MLTFAGIFLMHEAEQQRGCGIQAADRIAERGMHHRRRIALAAGYRGQP